MGFLLLIFIIVKEFIKTQWIFNQKLCLKLLFIWILIYSWFFSFFFFITALSFNSLVKVLNLDKNRVEHNFWLDSIQLLKNSIDPNCSSSVMDFLYFILLFYSWDSQHTAIWRYSCPGHWSGIYGGIVNVSLAPVFGCKTSLTNSPISYSDIVCLVWENLIYNNLKSQLQYNSKILKSFHTFTWNGYK